MYGAEAIRKCAGEFWASSDPGQTGGSSYVWAGVPAAIRERLRYIEIVDAPGLSLNPRRVNHGLNSGYQAIGLAYLWGAAKVVLLGYDMQRTGGKSHHHGDHEGGLPNLGTLDDWKYRMVQLGADLRTQGVEVINATRHTAITCFRREPIDVALSEGNQ